MIAAPRPIACLLTHVDSASWHADTAIEKPMTMISVGTSVVP